jgi:O-antigen/teichoic acid export membrane protein
VLTPAALGLIFYSGPVLRLWTRSDVVAQAAGSVVMVLAAAALLNGMMQVPYALQVAAGKLRIALWTNGMGVVVLVPLTIVMVRAFGLLGAGVAWLCFNVIYYFIVSVIIERIVFPLAPKFVLFKATMPPLLCGLAAFSLAGMLESVVGVAWYLSLPVALLIYTALVLGTGVAQLRAWLMEPTLVRG